MARKFLYVVAGLVVLVLAVLLALRIWAVELTRLAFVPDREFAEQEPLAADAYRDPEMWIARPGMGRDALARWQPDLARKGTTTPAAAKTIETQRFAVFFVHPTSFQLKTRWNAPLDERVSRDLAGLFVKAMASPFNGAREIWAPRYRQATLGAFLTTEPQADAAIDAAYRDVEQAFDYFLANSDPSLPIVLAGHSQGSVHLLRLLRERIVGTPLQQRIAMVYAVGWPISLEHDLPSLGLPACATPDQAGCVVSWLSFAEPADPGMMLTRYELSPGLDGEKRGGSPILCTDPLTGTMGAAAPASSNLGTLVPDTDLSSGELVAGGVPARCDAQGLLLIGDPPAMGSFVLPGNNYHVYDIPLFWRNLQLDVDRRMRTWAADR